MGHGDDILTTGGSFLTLILDIGTIFRPWGDVCTQPPDLAVLIILLVCVHPILLRLLPALMRHARVPHPYTASACASCRYVFSSFSVSPGHGLVAPPLPSIQ